MMLNARRFPALLSHLSSDKQRLSTYGAPEVVLLHGWGISSIIWDEWLPLLREYCHVTLIDLPGINASCLTFS